MRLCLRNRSEGAFDRVHARGRVGEVLEPCGRRRGGSERNRMRVSPPGPGQPRARVAAGIGVVSGPGERVTRLGAAPSDDRRAVGARLDDAAEVGRRGVVGFRLHDVHRHVAGAYRCARFGVGVDDGVLHRVDAYVRPGESRQGGDGKVVVMNDGADRPSGGGGNRAEGFSPRGSNVGVEGVGNGMWLGRCRRH